jgi:hypothetical protein
MRYRRLSIRYTAMGGGRLDRALEELWPGGRLRPLAHIGWRPAGGITQRILAASRADIRTVEAAEEVLRPALSGVPAVARPGAR